MHNIPCAHFFHRNLPFSPTSDLGSLQLACLVECGFNHGRRRGGYGWSGCQSDSRAYHQRYRANYFLPGILSYHWSGMFPLLYTPIASLLIVGSKVFAYAGKWQC